MSTAWFAVADTTFLVFFSAEVFLRLLAEELLLFLGGSWSWNCFDLIVVLSSLLDALLPHVGPDLGFTRMLRLLRVVRVLGPLAKRP